MINFSNLLPNGEDGQKPLPPELASRFEWQLIPESGSRGELKRALFDASDLCDELVEFRRQEFFEKLKEYTQQFSSQMLFSDVAKCAPMYYNMDLAERPSEASGIVYRRVFHPSGVSEVVWERSTSKLASGRLVFDDS